MSEWISVNDDLPNVGDLVIVQGKEFDRPMFASYHPSNDNFPWIVYVGHDEARFSMDCFDTWRKFDFNIDNLKKLPE